LKEVHDASELFAILEAGAAMDDGEVVDVLAHSLQCAALLADAAPDDLELQVAGLVHDVGTVLEPDQPATHAATAEAALTPLLGVRVGRLVGMHDVAKRYLVTVDPQYRAGLSARSVDTLAAQGGVLDDAERAALEDSGSFDDVVTLRRADDRAKVVGRTVAPLGSWRDAVDSVAAFAATRSR
jgi:predicted HD phosphohydrolase